MPHSKPHATLFSSDELIEPRKIGNQVVSDKIIKSVFIYLYIYLYIFIYMFVSLSTSLISF